MPAMRADYTCLGKCKTAAGGIAPVFEAATGTKFCPACGSKRVQQLFNNPNVIVRGSVPEPDWRLTRSDHSRTDTIQRDAYDQHRATRVQSTDIHSLPIGGQEREITLPGGRTFVQPSREQVAQMFGTGGQGHVMTSAEIDRK